MKAQCHHSVLRAEGTILESGFLVIQARGWDSCRGSSSIVNCCVVTPLTVLTGEFLGRALLRPASEPVSSPRGGGDSPG